MFAGLAASDFVIVIFGIIGIAMLFSYFQSKKKVEESQSWSTVLGYITKTHIRRETEKDNDGSRITKYYPEVLYTKSRKFPCAIPCRARHKGSLRS